MNTRYLTLAIFVTVTMSSLVGLAWMLDALPKSGKTYFVRLDDAGGLVEGNSVRIAGVQVGKIVRLDVEGNQARVEMRIDGKHKILEGTCASDQIKGMLGEKFLQLRQPKDGAELRPNSEITCVDPSVDMGAALNSLSTVIDGEEPIYPYVVKLMKRLDALTAGLDGESLMGKPGEPLKQPGEGTMKDDVRIIVAETAKLLKTTNEILDTNRGKIDQIVEGTRVFVTDPRLDRLLAKGDSLLTFLDRATPPLLAAGKELLEDGEQLVDKLDARLDAVDVAKVKKITDDLAAIADDGRKIAHDFRDVAKTTTPMLKDLATIARKAASINEKMIRQFTQIEGLTVHFIGPMPSVKRKYKELGDE